MFSAGQNRSTEKCYEKNIAEYSKISILNFNLTNKGGA